MKQTLLLLFLLPAGSMYGQQKITVKQSSKDTTNIVTFIVRFDKRNATKDGYYLGGYVVNIDHGQGKRLNGKKIKITGNVFIVKGLNNSSPEYDKNGTLVLVQGRLGDTKYIPLPTIEIIGK